MAAGLYLGATQIKNVYLGSTKASKVYLGSDVIWTANTTITATVAASADDGYANQSGSTPFSTTNGLLLNTTALYTGFVRFASVAIPAGSTISSADLSIGSWQQDAAGPNVALSAIDADNPAAPTSAATVQGASRTAASVTWQDGSVQTKSPDISTVIQEIVNRSGWQSGNAIVLLADIETAGSGNLLASDKSETLTVTYS